MWDCSCSETGSCACTRKAESLPKPKPARKPAPVDERTAYLKAQLEAIKKGEVRL
jgi:hypothetical protein